MASITWRGISPSFLPLFPRPPGPTAQFASSAGVDQILRGSAAGKTRRVEPAPAAGAARARARAPSRAPRRDTGHARRAAGFGGERVSARAAPDFAGGGGRGGPARREAGAELARETRPRLPGAGGCRAAGGGLQGRGPGRGPSPGPSCLVGAPSVSGDSHGPEGGFEVRDPRAKGAGRGVGGLDSASGLKPRLCVLGWSGARRRVRFPSL